MKRLVASLLAALIVAGLIGPVTVAAAERPAKVVIVVGPVGPGMTDRFRAQAREAAAIARRYTPDVTELYSPNATWPAVREALDGASVVVYMGHGNGWPSRYRDSLYPPTQNGFGLNPTAGDGDSRHQYFGEEYIASDVNLAKHAVVLLHHLCYASGNTEPGLPEGTLAQARQRVDNYAAGFIRAGASAVIAEAWSSPAYNVRAVLQGRRSIQSIWRNAPTANGNAFAFESARSPGYVAQMDPDNRRSGFHRSIVLKAGLAARDVLASGRGNPAATRADPAEPPEPTEPSLVGTAKLSAPDVRGLTRANGGTGFRIAFTAAAGATLPETVKASVRWDPLDVPVAPAEPASEVAAEPSAEPSPEPSTQPPPSLPTAAPDAETDVETEPSAAPGESAAPSTAPDPSVVGAGGQPTPSALPEREQPEAPPVHEPPVPGAPPDAFSLVQPERIGAVVEPVKGKVQRGTLLFPLAMPAQPGLYRLTVTLHDADGVAYDAATQALVAPMLVRVVGDHDAKVLATDATTLEAGTNVPLQVKVANLGKGDWGHEEIAQPRPRQAIPAEAAQVVGHWIALDPSLGTTLAPVTADLPVAMASGSVADATLQLAVPVAPGSYLLILDVVTPEHGSLASLGVATTTVRVTVQPAP
ncbi:MAG TPA: hypothetical protein VLA44_06450 [Clostridia bacterium]|nr:hypothetical protein [Clostridia bacterium]